ncbi:LSU ribosomal protein L9P [Hypnocyclicus thermotrophus]|uniref:Large ribosomal subunit protein bL9 n=1 Tax=Hypnocyclicus thermotrophus TaxID=1627895 RepID=A0AA46DZ80_9FUSO|nr:50S ribosomal protein L9 [Hypnocyclicus thermotrophus]TDT71486.1 LSU ribosomal protein L9P [Hypnocyclicus thermotrophus]
MSKIKVILKENIKGQGKKGEVISVSEGYAKNFLFAQKKAILATPEELKRLESRKEREAKKEEKEKEKAKKNKELLESKPLETTIKVGNNGKSFGAITSKEIAILIKENFNLDIDKKKIDAHFKNIGTHIAEVKLHNDVKANVKVVVKGK